MRRSGQDGGIAKLILLNGPPGVGKSTLARRYADDYPLTLHLEIDAIRTSLGGWESHEESRLLARTLAVAMADAHLRDGHDVIVAQYLGRTQFIENLDELAQRVDATFVEILLMDSEAAVADRFRARRRQLAEHGGEHPERDVDDSSVAEVISTSFEQLAAVQATRDRTQVVSTADGIEGAYRALAHAVAARED